MTATEVPARETVAAESDYAECCSEVPDYRDARNATHFSQTFRRRTALLSTAASLSLSLSLC